MRRVATVAKPGSLPAFELLAETESYGQKRDCSRTPRDSRVSIEKLQNQARYERTANLSPAPPRTVLTAADLRSLAVIYFNRGQYEDARRTFRRALQLLDQNSPASGIESARTYQLLAACV